MNEIPIRHDYSRGTHRNGWGIIAFEFDAPGVVKISAFGLKEIIPNVNRGQIDLLPGEEIVISMPDGDVLYEISEIRYQRDPPDMYKATIRYVQHLTGMRIVAQRDERQRARTLEWSRLKRQHR